VLLGDGAELARTALDDARGAPDPLAVALGPDFALLEHAPKTKPRRTAAHLSCISGQVSVLFRPTATFVATPPPAASGVEHLVRIHDPLRIERALHRTHHLDLDR